MNRESSTTSESAFWRRCSFVGSLTCFGFRMNRIAAERRTDSLTDRKQKCRCPSQEDASFLQDAQLHQNRSFGEIETTTLGVENRNCKKKGEFLERQCPPHLWCNLVDRRRSSRRGMYRLDHLATAASTKGGTAPSRRYSFHISQHLN